MRDNNARIYKSSLIQMDAETQQFLQERAERIRLIHERQEHELEQFDEESARLGFRLVFLNYYLLIRVRWNVERLEDSCQFYRTELVFNPLMMRKAIPNKSFCPQV